ncbi:hypothetical protein CHM34_11325 [Paludifilum halophilum]|uniref:Uncharacterized protein n=1 Tax=Paludifilum halophilum TaxID=1642702 RepID=A0A235B5B3_9BACL|nr:hypothetical protein CHM34_11325 [Paludifilum halophilum]
MAGFDPRLSLDILNRAGERTEMEKQDGAYVLTVKLSGKEFKKVRSAARRRPIRSIKPFKIRMKSRWNR